MNEIVRWMGAMQAQDYPMAKWAVGIRLPGSTDREIETSFDKGEILRTHLLRPTWHFVSAEDIYWILDLTAPHIITSMKSREKWLGLTKVVLAKSNRVIKETLSPNENLTREELITELDKAKIRTDEYRSGHLLMRAELEGLICSGKASGTKQTYALLEKRVPKKKKMNREESLKELARRYFSSRAPASLYDFAWWSGLPMIDARNALEMIKSNLISETINKNTYWFPDSFSDPPKRNSIFMLPAFDEFLIAYKNRISVLDHVVKKKLVSNNGIFRPIIVINGKVTGLWKRIMPARQNVNTKMEKVKLTIETKLFRRHTGKEKREIQKAAERFAGFLEMRSVGYKI